MTSRHTTTTLPSHIRPSSGLGTSSASASTSALQNRIHEKRLELEALKQLRDLSAGLAGQMQQLEDKLATLSNGTEAVAAVMSNWSSVLRAVNMASANIPKPTDTQGQDGRANDQALPQTLVRIPIQQAEAAQTQAQKEPNAGD